MWNLNLAKIKSLVPGGSLGNTAIETGTCRGNGTLALAKAFSHVYTIDLSSALSGQAKEKISAHEFSHVNFIVGDSAKELPRIFDLLQAEPIFIFLDAHWSGDDSVNWERSSWKGYGINTAHCGPGERTPTGPEQCPLVDELGAIVNHWPGRAYVLIDDMKNIPAEGSGLKDLTFVGEDWSHLSRELLLSVVSPRLLKLHELKDPEQWFLELGPSDNSAT